jgi:hypothetical protein
VNVEMKSAKLKIKNGANGKFPPELRRKSGGDQAPVL